MYEKNLWQLIWGNDVLKTMTLLGCEEKYLDGRASDFEAFREWIDAYHYMQGNVVADCTAEKIGKLVDLSATEVFTCDAAFLWGRHCGNTHKISGEKLYSPKNPERVLDCVKKEKIMSPFANVSDLLSKADVDEYKSIDEFEKHIENIGIYQFGMTVVGGEFIRPDSYHCGECYSEYIGGEKLQSNFISSQILLDMIYRKKCEIIHLIVEDEKGRTWANEFIKYLSFRELDVKIAVHFYKCISPEQVKETCLLNRNVIPVLAVGDEENITPFAKIIPRGIIA